MFTWTIQERSLSEGSLQEVFTDLVKGVSAEFCRGFDDDVFNSDDFVSYRFVPEFGGSAQSCPDCNNITVQMPNDDIVGDPSARCYMCGVFGIYAE